MLPDTSTGLSEALLRRLPVANCSWMPSNLLKFAERRSRMRWLTWLKLIRLFMACSLYAQQHFHHLLHGPDEPRGCLVSVLELDHVGHLLVQGDAGDGLLLVVELGHQEFLGVQAGLVLVLLDAQ